MCVQARFFDNYSARIDIGIKDPQEREKTLYPKDILNKVNAILRCKVYTRNRPSGTKTFLTIGQELSRLLLYATTKEPGKNWGSVQRNWLIDRCPVVVVECGKDELKNGGMVSMKGLHPISEIPEEWGVELYHKKQYQSEMGREIPVWIIVKREKARKDMVRALRIFLLKTHQERETLKTVMRLVHEFRNQDDMINCKKMETYLGVVTSTFSRERRDGVPQHPIMDVMRTADTEAFGDESADMLQYIERHHEELQYLKGRVETVTTNNFHVNIADNHGTINIGTLDKDAIKEILEQVCKLAEQKDGIEVREKTEKIKKELESKEPPKKAVLKGVITGLKAIKGSAEFMAAVGALADLLGVF